MVNSKFLVLQIKQLWVILIAFCCFAILYIGLDMIDNDHLSMTTRTTVINGVTSVSITIGAATTFFTAFVIGMTMLTSFILSILVLFKLFIRDINRGYIGAWLTLPLSRLTIISTKILTAFIYLTIYHLVSFVFQEILFGTLTKDFNGHAAALIFGINVAMYFTGILFLAISWIIICAIDKSSLSLTICSVILAACIAFNIIGSTIPKDFSPLYVLRYITVLAFTTNPFSFDTQHPITVIVDSNTSYTYNPIIENISRLAWQIPVPILASVPLFIGGIVLMKNKSFSI